MPYAMAVELGFVADVTEPAFTFSTCGHSHQGDISDIQIGRYFSQQLVQEQHF